jgi:hypothetical protein
MITELIMWIMTYIFIGCGTYYVLSRLSNVDEELLYIASMVWPTLYMVLIVIALVKVIYTVSSILVFIPINKLITYLIEKKSSVNKMSSDK